MRLFKRKFSYLSGKDQRQAIHQDTSSTRPAYTGGRRGERREDGDKRERRRRGELYANRQGPFNLLSLCFIAGHTYKIVTRGKRGEERR